ncbi:MAG TPA: hypothetical protein VGJ36_02915 [Gemmatimonadales bacterium]|jgi:hypothetical protein
MNVLKAGAMSALLGTLLFGCEDRNPAAISEGTTGPDAGTGVSAKAGSLNALMRWDIINADFATGTASAGGVASAFANDNSKITLTGSGTFRSNPGKSQNVTGGGDWTTYAPGGSVTGSGSYKVTGFVSFVLATGTPPLPNDDIGPDARPGLAVLSISYSDGSDGVLIVSCHFVGTSDAVFEGITATKGYVDYWNREAPPAPPGNANRTAFHILK